MKKVLILTFALISAGFQCSAQNYFPVYRQSPSFFYNANQNTIFSTRIDSFFVNGLDTTFYFPAMFLSESDGNGYYYRFMTKFNADTAYAFYTNSGDSFTLKLNLPLHEEFTVYDEPGIRTISARCISESVDSFLCITDSVRVFEFSVFDTSGNPLISHPLNEVTFSVSLSHGFTSFIRADYFPDFGLSHKFTIEGFMDNPCGYRRMRKADFYNHQPGDVIHHTVSTWTYPSIFGGESLIDSVIYRNYSSGNDTLIIGINRTRVDYNAGQLSLYKDTIDLVVDKLYELMYPDLLNNCTVPVDTNLLPGEAATKSTSLYCRFYVCGKNSCGKYVESTDYCNTIASGNVHVGEYCQGSDHYEQGSGKYHWELFWDYMDQSTIGSYLSECVFYSSGGCSFGTPIMISKVNEFSTPEYSLYPIPAQEFLILDTSEEGARDISILDIYGRTIIQSKDEPTPARIDLTSVPSGFYILISGEIRKIFIKI